MQNVELKLIEAESLYGGIMVDTKDFTFKTGVRTFEAAAFLKKPPFFFFGCSFIGKSIHYLLQLDNKNFCSQLKSFDYYYM